MEVIAHVYISRNESGNRLREAAGGELIGLSSWVDI
jgi:hypothetical protein